MKNAARLFFLVLVFLSANLMSLYAQGDDKHLPLSTKSEAAKTAFYEAIDRIHNADVANYELKINEAIKADPQFFMAHAQRALAMVSSKDSMKSKEHIDKALALPQDQLTPAEQTMRQMLVKLQEGKKDDLKPLVENIVSTYPNSIGAYELASDVSRFILDDQEAAFNYVQKLVEIAPEHASAYNTMGYYYIEKKDMAKAKEAFDKYLSLAPEEANAHDSMGDYYMAAGDYNKSAEHFNKAVAMGMDVSKTKADKATAMADDKEEDPNADFDTDTPDDEQDRDTLDSDIK